MGYAEAQDPDVLAHYEGLIFSTARLLRGHVEDEQEDVRQILRVKVWRALTYYDPAKARGMTRDRYVFMCLRDQAKDLAKKRKRGELFIEDLTTHERDGEQLSSRHSFDERYLSSSHGDVYGGIEDDDCVMPNALSETEREIVVMLYRDFRQTEIARIIGIDKRQMERAMRSIRSKLADWRPDATSVGAPPATRLAA